MRAGILQKIGFIGILLLYTIMSVYGVSYDIHTSGPDSKIPGYRIISDTFNQVLVFREQRPDYWSFLIKPVKTIISLFKFVYALDLKQLRLTLATAQYDAVAMLVIVLFAIYYWLSRTSSEKPGLPDVICDKTQI